MPGRTRASKNSAPYLVQLDRLEQGTEITLTEAFVALTLDDLEKYRADDILRENLQQHTIALARIAVDQNGPFLQRSKRLPVPDHAGLNALVIRVRRTLKSDLIRAQNVNRPINVIRSERNVLNPLALVLAQVFLDLALVVLRLIDRDPDLPARARHGP